MFKNIHFIFCKKAIQLSLQIFPTESKDSFDKPGKTKEAFACSDKILHKGSNPLCVAWIVELLSSVACGPSYNFFKLKRK